MSVCQAGTRDEHALSSHPPASRPPLSAWHRYMERHDCQLPLNLRMLGDVATRCGSYSKALHYRELEYQLLSTARASPRLVEALVSLHRALGQPEAAIGVLSYAQQRHDFTVKLAWLEKLGRWQDALTSYERAQLADPKAGEFALGRLRCLSALSEWQQLSRVSEAAWPQLSSQQQREASPLLAAARWHCQQWDGLQKVTQLIDPAQYVGGLFRAIVATHEQQYDEAAHWISEARTALQKELTPLANESYARCYDELVKAQQLSELEELIEHQLCQQVLAHADAGHGPHGGAPTPSAAAQAVSADVLARARETCDGVRQRWRARLRACARELRVWQPMVELRAMALRPHEQVPPARRPTSPPT